MFTTSLRTWNEDVLNKDQDPEQVESELEAPGSADSDESVSEKQDPYVDQEMADEYGWTPQQAREASLYL